LEHLEHGSDRNKNNQIVAVVDACFSGKYPSGESIVPNLQPLIATQDLDIGTSTVLSAAKHNEFAGPLPEGYRPAFSYLTLGAIQGWGDSNEDGFVSAEEVISFSKSTLLAVNKDRTQTPSLFGSNSNNQIGKTLIEPFNIIEIHNKLYPPKTKPFLLQRSILSVVVASGVGMIAKGFQEWHFASQAVQPDEYDQHVKQGDILSSSGLITSIVGSSAIFYYVQKGKKTIISE
jgi:hypothetical protein